MNLFKDSLAQKNDILQRISQALQLDDTRRERAEQSYLAVGKVLEEGFESNNIEIFPQGSFSIGTTVKPQSEEEYDLDVSSDESETHVRLRLLGRDPPSSMR